MALNTVQIASLLKSKIKEYDVKLDLDEVGEVVTIGDGVAVCYGLDNAFFGELIEFESGVLGMILNLTETSVGVALFGDQTKIVQGMSVKRTGKVMQVPVGDELIGRVVSATGMPIDGKGDFTCNTMSAIEKLAPGVMDRKSVDRPLETGIKVIDSVIPIGRGQRELIIGDRKTGKTQIAIDTIINQKGKDVKCVYVAIGQKQSTIANLINHLTEEGAMEYTTVVMAGASDLAPLQYIAPYTGIAIAEQWMNAGEDVLIVYDDLSKHASAYRTLSLLLRRPPGREAYPGDVFYLHSRLLERAAQLSDKLGGGSITALPIIETQAGDISAYIPTNVISITDGQLFLMADMFNSGQRPAVDPGLSVSRVGGAAQHNIVKKLSGSIKLELAQYRELEAFSKFGSDLDEDTMKTIQRGRRWMEALKQGVASPVSLEDEVIILFAVKNGYLDDIDVEKIKSFEMELRKYLHTNYDNVVKMINKDKKLTPEISDKLKEVVTNFKKEF